MSFHITSCPLPTFSLSFSKFKCFHSFVLFSNLYRISSRHSYSMPVAQRFQIPIFRFPNINKEQKLNKLPASKKYLCLQG